MDRPILKACRLVLISLALAVLFNFLFFDKLIGISFLIFVLALLVMIFLISLREKVTVKKTWWLILLIVFFSIMPGIRANEFLIFLNLCAVLGLLLLLARELIGIPAFLMKLRDYFTLIIVPAQMFKKSLSTFACVSQIHSAVKNRDIWLRVFKGIVMALPMLIIFGLLFAKADLVFSQFIDKFINITITPRSIQYIVLLLFSFIASLSLLSYIFFPKQTEKKLPDEKINAEPNFAGRGIEISVFMGLISALFLLFIGFQFAYLFGGESNIANAGFTYAEYARRGFWELLAVSALSLLILLASEKYSGAFIKRNWQFQIPAFFMVAEVIVIMFSAFKRLMLYIDAYNMTMLRFYVAGFIILLLASFVLLIFKFVLLKQEEFFAFGMLLLAATFLITVDFINPDAFIAKYNLRQFGQSGAIDIKYIGRLSADAEAEKIELYKKLQGEDREALHEQLQKEKNNLQKSSSVWQSANYSRSKALKLISGLEK